MTERRERWSVVLAAAAEADFTQILEWTAARFGAKQAEAYGETLMAAIAALTESPGQAGTKTRDDLGRGVRALPAARRGRKARHLILFRVKSGAGAKAIEVLRILHDSRHVAPDAAKRS
ncbi:MAG: type II toxin-antitoxin system RelE/ParE family toxin [Rhodospirillales bacterium]|nr:type II toxin-antitoxin system RelE/ParE family toxin [Rhodospirillales bacterium]